MRSKATLFNLILSIIYCFCCFFVLGMLIRIVIELKNLGEVNINIDKIIHLAKMSGVAGVAAGGGAWVFAKIDEYKKNKEVKK